ncbi:MAG TPA: hypothetical protein ENJ54_09450 [Chloroflexi bacterium]|nr:hypothetical protein [Chloroflexota bacterium]
MSLWRWLKRNFGTLLMSFLLAVAVWVSAVLSEDPNEVRVYPRAVEVSAVGLEEGLMTVDGLPASVRITLRAPRSVWASLEGDPTAVQAYVDLQGLQPGVYAVPVKVQVAYQPVEVVSVTPARLEITIDKRLTREVPVTVDMRGEVAVGYYASAPVVHPLTVEVSGPASAVSKVTAVQAQVSIEGARESFKRETALVPIDADGQRVQGVTIKPSHATVSVAVRQLGGYRDVAVKVRLVGQVANGYRITNVTVSPPVVTVFSQQPQKVRNLPGFVETEPLDISGATDDIDARLKLVLPEGISLVGEDTVLVQVNVAAIETSVTMSLPVEVTGLSADMEVKEISPKLVDVILSGPLPVLEGLQPSAVRVTVDVSGLTAGTYQLKPSVEVLKDKVQVESFLPVTVEVTLQPVTTKP